MNIQDLPLPLRLRNALTKAGFKTDDDLRDWFAGNGHAHADAEDGVIPGVGATGMKQLEAWANEKTATAAIEPAVIEPRTFGELADGYGTLEEAVAKSTRRHEGATTGSKRHEVVGLLDSAMRGGLEQLDSRRSDEEATRIHRRQFDAALEKEVSRGLAMAGTGSFGDMAAMFHASGGSVDVRSGKNARKLLALDLEADIQARIAALIPTIKALPHVKELGVEVSAETVGRMALIRGLDALDRAHGGGNGAKKGENRADPTENRDDSPVIAPPEDADVLDTPEGWTKVGPNEAIPIPEAVLHDYYTQNGWNRYWGRVDDQVIYFYWSPEKRLQDLKPFPGTDKTGRRMAEQQTPWGPGHVVPTKWTNS